MHVGCAADFFGCTKRSRGVRLVEHFFHRTTWGPRHPRGVSVRHAQKTTFRPIWTTGGKVGAQPLNRQNAGGQGGTAPEVSVKSLSFYPFSRR